ncbi:MAG TPA: DUF2520 domain-containing protein [Thermoanaerobaculia bacterium]|nr:DUF2520 domain-containing protein [Thermoanaerobaculia bacterium]
MRLGIIGGGRAAWSFGVSWQRAGWSVSGVNLRDGSRSRVPELLHAPTISRHELIELSDIIFIATSDRAVAGIASDLNRSAASKALFHASGSLTSQLFGSHPVGFSLHPLRALPEVGSPTSLEDSFLLFEGTDEARVLAAEICHGLHARMGELTVERKRTYHAAAVIGSNYVAALLEIAARLMEDAGLDSESMRFHLAKLARSAIEVWEDGNGPSRFTGPAARGDDETVRAHVEALESRPEVAEIYRRLAEELKRFTRQV